jgi:hypothetical protein
MRALINELKNELKDERQLRDAGSKPLV